MLWVLRYIHAHLALLQAPADLPRGATVPGVPHALPPPPPEVQRLQWDAVHSPVQLSVESSAVLIIC